ncbi:MAG TPA: NAD-dependent epimerase/dehydratase family protein [Micromonosporaceae bacterium]|jgi:nucleoside-diphosphate-sugar epimerase
MRLLILGGTVFLGRAMARHARNAGHDVTCAARGISGEPVDGVRFVAVDRDLHSGLSALDGATFDAVIDVARRLRHVRTALAALTGRVGHWTLVSSCSVYADQATPGQLAETAPTLPAVSLEQDEDEAKDDADLYGRRKVACEEAVVAALGTDRSFLCRAGLIVGPEDPSGRFAYWVRRLAGGGEVLAPGAPTDAVQFVDVRDLAAWLVYAGETGLAGTYDGIGAPMGRAEFLSGVAAGVAPEGTRFTWVDQEFLLEHRVEPWMGDRSLPLWLPLPEYAGFLARDTAPALAAGLSTRDAAGTARDTLDWLADRPGAAATGLASEDETNVLAKWHERLR